MAFRPVSVHEQRGGFGLKDSGGPSNNNFAAITQNLN